MDMMEQRETLAEARSKRDLSALEKLVQEMSARQGAVEGALAAAFEASHGEKDALVPLVAKLGELRYYRRFLEEASAIADDLGHAS
jgi:molecular chaperone HscB